MPDPPTVPAGLLKEHRWLVRHSKEIEKYRGRWIAVLGERVVAVGTSYEEVFNLTKKQFPSKYPLITYIFKKEEENLIAPSRE